MVLIRGMSRQHLRKCLNGEKRVWSEVRNWAKVD